MQPSLVSTPDTPNVRTTFGRTVSGADDHVVAGVLLGQGVRAIDGREQGVRPRGRVRPEW